MRLNTLNIFIFSHKRHQTGLWIKNRNNQPLHNHVKDVLCKTDTIFTINLFKCIF